MKPSEIIKAKIEAKGGELKSRQVISVLEYLDEQWEKENAPVLEDEQFVQFYSAYPNKKAKPMAIRAWKRLKMTPELFKIIMTALEAHKRTPQWTKDRGAYIPMPSTWLNNRRWEDKLATENESTSRFKGL